MGELSLGSKIGHKEIAECFENAWKGLVADYKKNGRYLFRDEKPEDAAGFPAHYWGERDVQARLATLLMSEVSKISKEKGREVEVHLDYPMRREYHEILEGKWIRSKPIVDIVVSSPLDGEERRPFKLFAEVKYWQRTRQCEPRSIRKRWFEKDIKKLAFLLNKQICKVAYCCFVDEQHTNNPKTKKAVRQFLDEKEKETGVRCLHDGIGFNDWVRILKKRKPRG